MQTETNDLPPPVNHIFVDYENVREVDPAIIGAKTVHVTLLLGAQKTKLDATLVEKLLQHAAHVELIRLKSSGRNALDFALAYYLGRAVLADPCGYFHLVSKDTGYDPLIEHLRSKHIRVRRHDDYSTLTLSAPPKASAVTTPATPKLAPPVTPATPSQKTPVPATKPEPRPKPEPSDLEKLEAKVLAHLRKPATKRPGTQKNLVSYLISHLGKKITEAQALALINMLSRDGHLAVDDKGKVTYH